MTLVERAQELRGRIERHSGLRQAHKNAEALRARIAELKQLREQIAASTAKLIVLATQGGLVASPPDASGALNSLSEYKARIADPEADPGKEYTRLRRSLERVQKDIDTALDKGLKALEKDLPSIDESFLKQVEQIPAYTERVATIRRERDVLLKGKNLSAMSAEQLATFLKQREVVKTHADTLKVAEFPDEVLEFFSAARRTGGASLDKLTDTVRRWLSDRDQLKNVRVIVK